MTLPGFTAEAAFYSASGLYRASSSDEAGPHVAYTAQLLTTLEHERAVRRVYCFYPCRCIPIPTGTGDYYCYYPCELTCLYYWGPWGYYGG
jgi:hypothetical protein